MSRSVGFITTGDGRKRWLLYNNGVEMALRTLYLTEEEADAAWETESFSEDNERIPEYADLRALASIEVDLCTDRRFESDRNFHFTTSVDTDLKWITGPASLDEIFDTQLMELNKKPEPPPKVYSSLRRNFGECRHGNPSSSCDYCKETL